MYQTAFPRLFPWDDSRFRSGVVASDLDWADHVVFGGGNIVDRHFLGLAARAAKRRPVSLMSVGCSDPTVTAGQLEIFDRIWVRDTASRDRISSLGVHCDLAPDASWCLEADAESGRRMWDVLFESQEKELYERRVAVILNAHLTSAQPDVLARDMCRWQVFSNDLVEVVDATSASFAFVPFGRGMPWDDRAPNSWVAHRCKWHKKNAVVWDEWGVQETLDFLSASDVVVSMRLHGTIFGCIGGVPFLDVTHHSKNQAFLDSVGMGSRGVPYWDFSRVDFSGMLSGLLSDGGGFREELVSLACAERRRLLGYVAGLSSSIKGG